MGIFTTIWGAIAGAANWFWYKATLKTKLVILATFAILCVIGYIIYLQSKVENLEHTVEQTNINAAVGNAMQKIEEANKLGVESNKFMANANEFQANANKIRNANFKNTSLSESERMRCAAYPESCR